MKTQRQLARASLFDLGKQLLDHQIGLKLIQSDRFILETQLMDVTDAEAYQRSLIGNLHRKIRWELANNKEHLDVGLISGSGSGASGPGAAGEQPPYPGFDESEGEEWKGGGSN